jgi:A/G-specific adenine glycosylase
MAAVLLPPLSQGLRQSIVISICIVSQSFAQQLLNWYSLRARHLPWREQPSPYAVWISEIMLQQTRVETVLPYFLSWMERFPDVETLANSSLQDVLSAWEGLGYYGRARNLHRAAQIIVDKYAGMLPADPGALRKLPGIGRYTAGAIASIAFGQDEPALDGNIRRVLARVFDVCQPARSPEGERILWELAAQHLPPGQAGAYNQALMDLGATLCTPRSPDCPNCPVVGSCQAYVLGIQEQRPVLTKRAEIPHHTVTAAVIWRGKEVLIAQRPLQGLLGGLWEFPGGKLLPGEDLVSCLQREICEELGVDIEVGETLGVFRHAYTHFRVTLHAFTCSLKNGAEPRPVQVKDLQWVRPAQLDDYPMGKIDRQIAARLQKEAVWS